MMTPNARNVSSPTEPRSRAIEHLDFNAHGPSHHAAPNPPCPTSALVQGPYAARGAFASRRINAASSLSTASRSSVTAGNRFVGLSVTLPPT